MSRRSLLAHYRARMHLPRVRLHAAPRTHRARCCVLIGCARMARGNNRILSRKHCCALRARALAKNIYAACAIIGGRVASKWRRSAHRAA